MKRILLALFSVVLLIAALGMIQGCSENDKIVEPVDVADNSEMGFDIDDYPFTEYLGISADSVNALARAAMEADTILGSGSVQKTSGWQLYVSVPFYSQRDQAWRDTRLGFGRCGTTIGSHGCYLTCISMLYAKWGYYNMNPKALNNWRYGSRSHYAFSSSGCGDLIRIPYAIHYPGMSRPYRSISPGQIYGELRRGHPVIIKINGGAHFMVIFAFDGRVFWVKDPIRNAAGQNRPLYGNFAGAYVYGYF